MPNAELSLSYMRRKTLPLLKPSRSSDAFIRRNYILYDRFDTARAAGAMNGTSAEPVGGTRTVTDTNNKLSISNGVVNIATGGAAANDPILSYSTITRLLGRGLLFTFVSGTRLQVSFGTILSMTNGSSSIVSAANGNALTALTSGLTYRCALVMRTSGGFIFVQGGTEYSAWRMVWAFSGESGNQIPKITIYATNGQQASSVDNIRIPKKLYIPVPLQSDGFSAATTDGLGNAEGNGVAGNAWADAVGTWGVAGGVASASALSGGIAIRTISATSADVIADLKVTRSAGNAGLVVRYQDVNNYIHAYHDGTNALLVKVVAGTPTTLVNAAATYSAGAVLRVVTDGTAIRLFYNNAAVGTVQTVTDFATATTHGLYTTNTGNTFDEFVLWARGTGNEYSGLNAL